MRRRRRRRRAVARAEAATGRSPRQASRPRVRQRRSRVENGAEASIEPAIADEPDPSGNGAEPAADEYVPMSEWLDDLDA